MLQTFNKIALIGVDEVLGMWRGDFTVSSALEFRYQRTAYIKYGAEPAYRTVSSTTYWSLTVLFFFLWVPFPVSLLCWGFLPLLNVFYRTVSNRANVALWIDTRLSNPFRNISNVILATSATLHVPCVWKSSLLSLFAAERLLSEVEAAFRSRCSCEP